MLGGAITRGQPQKNNVGVAVVVVMEKFDTIFARVCVNVEHCEAFPTDDNNNTHTRTHKVRKLADARAGHSTYVRCVRDCVKGISGLVDHTFILFRSAAGNDRLSWRKPIIDGRAPSQCDVGVGIWNERRLLARVCDYYVV